jgi:hypothetical protein
MRCYGDSMGFVGSNWEARMRAIAPVIGLVLAGLLGFWSGSASAAARTWVSGLGDDGNAGSACPITAPCKTFAIAIGVTDPGGEIDVLSPGGFGVVTITKAITIDGGGGVASVLASGTNGVTISAGASDVVTLRNLSFNGVGAGLSGIRFQSGGALQVEHCVIMNFTQNGIDFAPSGASRLTVVDTIATNNAVNGIRVDPQSGGSAKVSLTRVTSSNNGGGFRADGTAAGAGAINATVTDSETSNNTNTGVNAVSGSGAVFVILNRVATVNNGAFGIQASQSGANASVLVGSSTITGNNIAGNPVGGGTVASYGNNQINGNITSNGTFSAHAPE